MGWLCQLVASHMKEVGYGSITSLDQKNKTISAYTFSKATSQRSISNSH